jgi:predicted small lipoprotein YifL
MKMTFIIFLLLACFCLSACGQSGKLYLPNEKPSETSKVEDEDE